MIGAGELRQHIRLQKPTYTTDDAGAYVPSSYTTVTTAWAKIIPASDSKRAQAAQTIGEISHTVTIRHDPRVKSDWRILYGTRYLHIVGPPRNIDERGEFDELRCIETEVM